jgi:hypothetical protein
MNLLVSLCQSLSEKELLSTSDPLSLALEQYTLLQLGFSKPPGQGERSKSKGENSLFLIHLLLTSIAGHSAAGHSAAAQATSKVVVDADMRLPHHHT